MQRLISYFSFQGRTNRQRYWMTALALFGLFFLSIVLAAALFRAPPLSVIVLPIWLALIVASIANGARRLHDRGKSAWWLLVFLGVPGLLAIPAQLLKIGGGPDAQAASDFFVLLGLPFSIWGFVVVGCLKGAAGPNKYGEDPIAPPAQAAFA